MNPADIIPQQRQFMKSNFAQAKGLTSDQASGLAQPPLQKPADAAQIPLDLPAPDAVPLVNPDLRACLLRRRSLRSFTDEPLNREELAFLLWATQGVIRVNTKGTNTLRPVPSAGARHPYETYLLANRVTGLEPGVYRYLPLSHQLVLCHLPENMPILISQAVCGQDFVGHAAAVLAWACIPYRGEWRYSIRSHKTMLLDAGHIMQNLYLAAEGLGLGTCAIAAYDQEDMDRLLRIDGQNEYTVYLAPVGRPASVSVV